MMISSVVSAPSTFRLIVFDGVKNASDVRSKVTGGKVAASLVSPRLLCHTLPLLIAIEKSIQSRKIGKMITRTIFTEVLYNLSFTKNITESLKTFGVKEDETSFLAVLFDDDDNNDKGGEGTSLVGNQDKIDDLKEIVEFSELISGRFFGNWDTLEFSRGRHFHPSTLQWRDFGGKKYLTACINSISGILIPAVHDYHGHFK